MSSQSTHPSRPAGKPSGAARREREAARRALAENARTRAARRRRLLTVLAPIGVVVLVLIAFLAVRAGGGNNHSGKKSTGAAAAVIAQVTGVPAAALDAAGAGTTSAALSRITGNALTADGKPRVLYIGAEYCPFCAAERWPVIVALSRFGTWSGLDYSYSGPSPEVYPNTATFTFHGASYRSEWISFTGVETQTNQQSNGTWTPLDKLAAADEAIMRTHDAEGSIPFTDLAGRYVIVGATYKPELLTGKSHAQIAATLTRPADKTGTAIDAAANVLTAALCQATNGQPASVCTSAGVTAAAKALPGAS